MKPLHYKKHTLAKRGLSLLCVLALCLGLLPTTALAEGDDKPGTLWVGQTQITGIGYWTTDANGKLAAGDASNYNVYYDGNSTLTLNNATIQGGDNVSQQDPQDYGIYASSTTSQSVALTINLIGTNTVKGVGGIYITSDGNSSLVIQSDSDASKGSLEVSGSDTTGIYIVVSSNSSGNPSLTINNASVEASTEKAGYYGVSIVSYTTSSPTLSLTVNGGSLTAQDGIRYVSVAGTNSSTSLMVSDDALIKSIPDISASGASKPTPQAASDSGGIVFDGNSGTVYGKVELQDDLTINEGETLTVGKDASLTVPEEVKLTNNGKIDNSGELNGTVDGSGTVTPKITTDRPMPEGTVGEPYTAKLEATGNNITWSASGLPDGLTLNSDGTINGTPTTAGTSTFTVKAENTAGSDSKELTLTINPAPVLVTGVTLEPTSLTLFTGDTATLTATVQPENATNKAVNWSSSDEDVATVDTNGKVTAVKEGTAAITATAEDDSNISATCMVTVIDKTYTISADPTALNFGSAYTGYTQPAAQTVTVKNTGNQTVTLNQPASTSSFEVGTLSKTELAAGETATFTVQPKVGLSAGTYSDTITVSDTNNNVTSSITASFTVKSRPSYNPPTVSEETIDAIADAQPGEMVTVDLSSGSTKLDKEVFETLAGKDVTLVIDLGDGVSWTVNGSDISEDTDFVGIDMGVTMGSDGIPVEVVNAITGERSSVQITLAHDGAFGFTMTLTAPLGTENAGLWANLYYFDEDANAMTFETAAPIGSDGSVSLAFSHASQYAIVIDNHNHGVVTLPFTDVSDSDWFYNPVVYVYSRGLMTGTSATTFEPNTHLSRAMLVAVLHRLEGSPQASGSDFTDVADGDWYAQAVNWAASVGVVNGFDDGTFQPNAAITREQMAAILMNYAQYKGQDVSARATLDTYNDATAISSWANDVMSWAVAEGLLTGVTNDQLQPQGNATRAQVAAILERFLAE